MKKKSILLLTIILLATVPIIVPTIVTVIPSAFFHNNSYGAELAIPFDASVSSATESLPEYVPFWVDIVDAEFMENEGEGVYVAVLDTGLLANWPDLFLDDNIADEYGIGFTHENIWWDWDLMDYAYDPTLKIVDHITDFGSGHGTHVASTIVGFNVYDYYRVRGVAPKAKIIPVLVLDGFIVPDAPPGYQLVEFGTDEMVSEGIYYAADLVDELDGPLIISMSLGDDVPAPMIEDAINYAIDKGVIVVASAGNAGYEGMGWPGAYPQVISCAMGGWTMQPLYSSWLADVSENLNSYDELGNNWQTYLHPFSSRPNKDLSQKSFHLDVTTPGAAIVGPFKIEFSSSWGYYYLWGTSMSAPHVSGIASLVLEEYPNVEQAEMEKILKNAAHGCPLPADGAWVVDIWDPVNEVAEWGLYFFEWFGNDYGAGFLQADAALKSASKFVK
jgi:subtilisin family serine protease